MVVSTRLTGIIATNTTISRENLISPRIKIENAGQGGLSGAPLAPVSDRTLVYLKMKCPSDLVIISSGGIMNPEIAEKRLDEGAGLVQIYTGFIYEGPGLIKRIKQLLLKARQ